MVPSIYGENMFDDFFENGFFGGHSPLFGKHARNLMKTDIRETDDAKAYRFAVELPGFEKDEIHVILPYPPRERKRRSAFPVAEGRPPFLLTYSMAILLPEVSFFGSSFGMSTVSTPDSYLAFTSSGFTSPT